VAPQIFSCGNSHRRVANKVPNYKSPANTTRLFVAGPGLKVEGVEGVEKPFFMKNFRAIHLVRFQVSGFGPNPSSGAIDPPADFLVHIKRQVKTTDFWRGNGLNEPGGTPHAWKSAATGVTAMHCFLNNANPRRRWSAEVTRIVFVQPWLCAFFERRLPRRGCCGKNRGWSHHGLTPSPIRDPVLNDFHRGHIRRPGRGSQLPPTPVFLLA